MTWWQAFSSILSRRFSRRMAFRSRLSPFWMVKTKYSRSASRAICATVERRFRAMRCKLFLTCFTTRISNTSVLRVIQLKVGGKCPLKQFFSPVVLVLRCAQMNTARNLTNSLKLRLNPTMRLQLEELAVMRHLRLSDVCREAFRRFLEREEAAAKDESNRTRGF